MSDDESIESRKEMKNKILLREKMSKAISIAIPTMHTQLTLNKLARTDLSNHMEFLNKLDIFHENLRLYFYPKIFENQPVEKEDWSKFTPEFVSIPHPMNWKESLTPLLVTFLFLGSLALFNLRGYLK